MRLHEIIEMKKKDIEEMFFFNGHGYAYIPSLVNHKYEYSQYVETGYYKFTVVYCLRIPKAEFDSAKKYSGFVKQMELFHE